MTAAPLVRVVVVNYEGGDLTIACLKSLQATEWPSDRLEVVLVDNASHDGIAATVERELVDVRVVRSNTNRGFAGGCNLGLEDLGAASYVALVNNDATVEPGWLQPLVETLVDNPALGAACPKILLEGRFVEVSLESTTHRPGRGDRRDLGVRVLGVRVDSVDRWRRVQLREGFWGREPDGPGEWTSARARLWLPAGTTAELRLGADRPTTVRACSGTTSAELHVGTDAAWHTVPFAGSTTSVVNNVGTELTADLHGADRGYLEPDDGRFDDSQRVFAWCGAATVLRREYLDDVGTFDERLFVYYEDLELSWRGRKRGWRYGYVPTSVVHHVHAATTVEGSALKNYYGERNQLLVLARHAAAPDTWRAMARFLLVTASYLRRDVLSPLLRGRRPHASVVGQRLRAFGAFVARVPGMLRSRRRDRRSVSRA